MGICRPNGKLSQEMLPVSVFSPFLVDSKDEISPYFCKLLRVIVWAKLLSGEFS